MFRSQSPKWLALLIVGIAFLSIFAWVNGADNIQGQDIEWHCSRLGLLPFDVTPDEYVSDSFAPDDLDEKAGVIRRFLQKMGVSVSALCSGNCDEGETCVAVRLYSMNGGDDMELKLVENAGRKRYWAIVKDPGNVKLSCDCECR